MGLRQKRPTLYLSVSGYMEGSGKTQILIIQTQVLQKNIFRTACHMKQYNELRSQLWEYRYKNADSLKTIIMWLRLKISHKVREVTLSKSRPSQMTTKHKMGQVSSFHLCVLLFISASKRLSPLFLKRVLLSKLLGASFNNEALRNLN